MKIEKISCTQFAGILDRDISFTDGINVIYGKNESGKSTLVNLISRTLFQNAKIDGRKDKDFKSLYFPGKRKGSSVSGDFADGKITFSTDSGRFTLSKEWGNESRCTLSTPNGVIRDQKKISSILREELIYGEGVYSEMLFSSQTAANESLQTILDETKKTDGKKEIVDVVSKAFSESDGITSEVIGEAIDAKIKEIEGQQWDSLRKMPKRNPSGERWKKGLGEILKAYYALEDAKLELDKISELESQSDEAAAKYTKQEAALKAAENDLDRYSSCIDAIREKKAKEELFDRYKNDLEKLNAVYSQWPAKSELLEKAKALKIEQANREILDQYEKAKSLYESLTALRKETEDTLCPSDKEIKDLFAALRKIDSLENKLCGINLNAAIKMVGGHSISITSLRTGEKLDIANGSIPIGEAVNITIPDVMEMRLTPSNVDAEEIEAQLSRLRDSIASVFHKYNVQTAEELEALSKKAAEIRKNAENTQVRFDLLMGRQTYEELLAQVNEINDNVRSKSEIEHDILTVCATSDVARFITVTETVINEYVKEYVSISQLQDKIKKTQCDFDQIKASQAQVKSIPREYADIEDLEGYLKRLRNNADLARKKKDNALSEKSAASSRLAAYEESLSSDPAEKVELAQRIFDETMMMLSHWKNIKRVFDEQKATIDSNPLHDIGESFTRYLGIISGGKISFEFLKSEKLDMNIYSDDRVLDFEKLSEGTKETVSLAFRLAVLEHLFPDGGGVIVFDDPFANMDNERAARSYELIKKCAEDHQVIFLTCRDDNANMSGANLISLEG